MLFFLLVQFLSTLKKCQGEEFKGWYIPADKLERAPKHSDFVTNADVFKAWTLKKPLFSGEEYDTGVNETSWDCVRVTVKIRFG